MPFENCKIILSRRDAASWATAMPAIGGYCALMKTREAALAALANGFSMISEMGLQLPVDSTEIVNA